MVEALTENCDETDLFLSILQVTAHLQAGQKVWVRQEEGTAVRGAWFTVFTGYLIQAD